MNRRALLGLILVLMLRAPLGEAAGTAMPMEAAGRRHISPAATDAISGSAPETIIIDHTCTDLSEIPSYWIDQAKELAIHYAHTSHGSQITSGLEALDDPTYGFSRYYAGAEPPTSLSCEAGALCMYDGNPPETYITPEDYWSTTDGIDRTASVADTGLFDYSMWSWCGQQSYNSVATVQQYLDTMAGFEATHPHMRFILMTGHTDGGSPTLRRNNDVVRQYAVDNDMVLFDFADIETYDPLGGGPYHNDGEGTCTWCVDFCTHHPAYCTSLPSSCAHSETHPQDALFCKLKGHAFWWMMARLAGWGGPAAEQLRLNVPNGGEDWTVGSQHQIAWTSSGIIGSVNLAYSTDGFATSHTIDPSTPNDGSYTWTIPDDPSTTVRVRVASVVSPTTVYDESDSNFAIVAVPGADDYLFHAAVEPLNATEPVAYDWSPEPASGQGTASATYRWTPGTYQIGVAASNCGGTVSAERTVTVGSSRLASQRPSVATSEAGRAAVERTMTFQNGVSPDAGYAGAADATITTWSGNSYANLGGLDYLQIGEAGDVDQFRLLVRFDLDGWLPAGVRIDEAQLELRAYDSGYDDDPQDGVARAVTAAWLEGDGWDLTADGRSEGVTWVTARPGVAWATPGGDVDPAELDRETVAANPDGWYRWDVTSAVRGWASDGASNHGLLLEPDDAPWTHHQFHASECATTTLRPRLVVTYTGSAPADHAVYLPLVLRSYAPEQPCPHPLTGVTISGPHALAYYPDGDTTGPIHHPFPQLPAGLGPASTAER